MYIIKITNKVQSIIEFGKKEEREKMVEAIKNCINNPDEYPNILYSDQKSDIIFSAEYLKNSFIEIPLRK